MFKWFLTDRLRMRSLVLPTDPPDRVQRIMQFVEKRIIRSIPQPVKGSCRTVLVGLGSTGWKQVTRSILEAGFAKPCVIPWPSGRNNSTVENSECLKPVDCLVFTSPSNNSDLRFIAKLITERAPQVIVCDSHPLKPLLSPLTQALNLTRTAWRWDVNSASLGTPQSRMRRITVSGHRHGGWVVPYGHSLSFGCYLTTIIVRLSRFNHRNSPVFGRRANYNQFTHQERC